MCLMVCVEMFEFHLRMRPPVVEAVIEFWNAIIDMHGLKAAEDIYNSRLIPSICADCSVRKWLKFKL